MYVMMKWAGLIPLALQVTPCTSAKAGVMWGSVRKCRLMTLKEIGSLTSSQDEWMATCFLNNVYCYYLPALCSHGLQPFDNGVFNVVKGACRKELQKLAS
jgi:hypothetical protein